MVEVKSKSLPDRVMKLIENITEKEAKKLQGEHQVCKLWNYIIPELFCLLNDICLFV